MALVITRRAIDGEDTVHLGNDITIVVARIGEGKVRLAITAPDAMHILRGELLRDVNRQASSLSSPPELGGES